MTLWSGRFSDRPDDLVMQLSESVSFDKRLYAHDIRGTKAHVTMLAKQGIVSETDAAAICHGLDAIQEEIEQGSFSFDVALEDVHMNIESALIRRLGDIGARVHAGRSRNDQVATDMRLYLRDETEGLVELVRSLQRALVSAGERYEDAILPGFTHLQYAQPVLFAHHMLAYVEMLERDQQRISECRARLNVSPLGSGALAGATLPLDREFTAKQLDFAGVTRNSMDAVSDRDFMVELLADLSLLMMHLSRLSEDLIFWMSQACGYIQLGDQFCTGSSLMPQKKNPDICELARGKTGRVYGSLMGLLTVLKGLPLCYNRDLQEDKEGLFDALDTAKVVLATYAPMLDTLEIDADAMLASASDPMLMATDLAEWLVAEGVPFRQAHERVGKLVAFSQQSRIALDQMTLEQIQESVPEAKPECLDLFDPKRSVAARNLTGGTAPEQVHAQLAFWRSQL